MTATRPIGITRSLEQMTTTPSLVIVSRAAKNASPDLPYGNQRTA